MVLGELKKLYICDPESQRGKERIKAIYNSGLLTIGTSLPNRGIDKPSVYTGPRGRETDGSPVLAYWVCLLESQQGHLAENLNLVAKDT